MNNHKIDRIVRGKLIELLKRAGKLNIEIIGFDLSYVLLGFARVSVQHQPFCNTECHKACSAPVNVLDYTINLPSLRPYNASNGSDCCLFCAALREAFYISGCRSAMRASLSRSASWMISSAVTRACLIAS